MDQNVEDVSEKKLVGDLQHLSVAGDNPVAENNEHNNRPVIHVHNVDPQLAAETLEVLEQEQDVLDKQQQEALEDQQGLPTPTREELWDDLAKSSDEDDEEFEDAVTETDDQFVVASSNGDVSAPKVRQGSGDTNSTETPDLYGYLEPYKKGRQRRRLIPVNPNLSVNLWSIMKNCIGRDLTRIPVPVNFGEPLSFLQRLTEEFEYSSLLDQAASCFDPWEQMAYLVAYTVSPYASTSTRTGKPFNPLLGETYECDRTEDLGWRSISEQVCHHPPIAAIYTEGRAWISWQEFTMSSKFRGKYIQIVPLGMAQIEFSKTGNHYTWCKVNTVVHNIIVGRLWVDNQGEMDITNHTTGDKCHITYVPYSYFSRDTPRKVTGVITDAMGVVRWLVNGTWDEKMEGTPVLGTDIVNGNPVHKLGETKVLWQRRYPLPELDACYHFTEFAVQLNEMEVDVAPTDSRHRPDQRLMEQGRWDEANAVKIQLEDKQRAARHKLELEAAAATAQGLEAPVWKPRWFKKGQDSVTGGTTHIYTGEYWRCKESQDWSRCPDIFL